MKHSGHPTTHQSGQEMGLLPDSERYLVTAVDFKDGNIYVSLANGVMIGNPLKWFRWLEAATPQQRAHVEFAILDVYFPDLTMV